MVFLFNGRERTGVKVGVTGGVRKFDSGVGAEMGNASFWWMKENVHKDEGSNCRSN